MSPEPKTKDDLFVEIITLQRTQDELAKRISALEQMHKEMLVMMQPISDVFNNVNGFGKVSLLILKGLAVAGAGIGTLYALLRWLKN